MSRAPRAVRVEPSIHARSLYARKAWDAGLDAFRRLAVASAESRAWDAGCQAEGPRYYRGVEC